MKLEIKVILPTGEDVFFSLDEAKELYLTLKDIFGEKNTLVLPHSSTPGAR